eukprot:12411627-Ditylum_brightwellii.AAC.1
MSKLGTIHPPGGALAIVFSAGNNTWNQVGTHLAGDVIAIAIAAWINNLSYIRQYPTFWGVTDYHQLQVIKHHPLLSKINMFKIPENLPGKNSPRIDFKVANHPHSAKI